MTAKFKIGDTVTASEAVGYNDLKGQSGTVVGHDRIGTPLVLFGADVQGHAGLGLVPDVDWGSKKHHWFVPERSLSLTVPAAPKEPTAPMTMAVLDLLKVKGALTSLEAQGVLRCRQLPARILELKRLGWGIVTERKRDQTGQSYARYHLQQPIAT